MGETHDKGLSFNIVSSTYGLRSRSRRVDDACRMFALQVADESTFQVVGLLQDVSVIAATGESQQDTMFVRHL